MQVDIFFQHDLTQNAVLDLEFGIDMLDFWGKGSVITVMLAGLQLEHGITIKIFEMPGRKGSEVAKATASNISSVPFPTRNFSKDRKVFCAVVKPSLDEDVWSGIRTRGLLKTPSPPKTTVAYLEILRWIH